MSLKARLMKLEEGLTGKALFDMTDAEIERFLCESHGMPAGSTLTDELLWKLIDGGKVRIASMTQEEALERLQ